MSTATHHGSPVADAASQRRALPFGPADPQDGSLEAEWQNLDGAGFSADIISTALTCTRPTSHKGYDARLRAFVGWCDEQDFNLIDALICQVWDFIQEKPKYVQLNIVLRYVTAISNRHALVETGMEWQEDREEMDCWPEAY